MNLVGQMSPHKKRTAVGIFVATLVISLSSCSSRKPSSMDDPPSTIPVVAVTKVTRKPLASTLTLSSELVPFQQIDVFAKESGYVSKLYVDYGSHVKKGQVLAILEIPELEDLLHEDKAEVKAMTDQVTDTQDEITRIKDQHKVLHLEYERLSRVARSRPGLVAEQEIDDAQGKDLAAEAQVEEAKSHLQSAESQLAMAESKLAHDQALFSYSRITAPFSGVVTKRYANLGTLMQAGTNSSTQAIPLVQLSEEDMYRLVIPVPENYVQYIHVDDPVKIQIPALGHTFPGQVARFSYDINDSTRTMHTEVDVPNRKGLLMPGMYATATLTVNHSGDALAIPIEAVNQQNDHATVWVVGPDGKLQNRVVLLGVQTPNYAEVVSGVKDGEEIVLGSSNSLKVGEVVRPKLTKALTYPSQG